MASSERVNLPEAGVHQRILSWVPSESRAAANRCQIFSAVFLVLRSERAG